MSPPPGSPAASCPRCLAGCSTLRSWLVRSNPSATDAGFVGYNGTVTTISVEEIERDLVNCLARVKAGETLVVTEAEQPVAELRAVVESPPDGQSPRPFGLAAGEFTVPDDFDEPLPEAILRLFEGK